MDKAILEKTFAVGDRLLWYKTKAESAKAIAEKLQIAFFKPVFEKDIEQQIAKMIKDLINNKTFYHTDYNGNQVAYTIHIVYDKENDEFLYYV
jgi:hypothetical protein